MHKGINNLDINKFDLNETLGVFLIVNYKKPRVYNKNDKWMRESEFGKVFDIVN